jgi:hypothetical protein
MDAIGASGDPRHWRTARAALRGEFGIYTLDEPMPSCFMLRRGRALWGRRLFRLGVIGVAIAVLVWLSSAGVLTQPRELSHAIITASVIAGFVGVFVVWSFAINATIGPMIAQRLGEDGEEMRAVEQVDAR